jgi:Fur family ferric uptake transcriptional regulator
MRAADEDAVRAALHDAGLRVTAPRLAVYAALCRDGGHHDADTVARAARARLGGSLSTQAVYDALATFARIGLVRRIEPAGSPSAVYETRVADNHHHVVCRACGAIADVACTRGAAPCLEPSADRGFVIDEAEVTFWGFCPLCQSTPRPREIAV